VISFWVDRGGSHGIQIYCENRGRAIAGRFRAHLYEDIPAAIRLPAGAQVFAAIDRLTSLQREAVALIWDAHAEVAPSTPRLNDPRHVLLRFELLTRLHQEGLNTFRVFRAHDARSVNRFPVFIRDINRHHGPRSALLTSRRDLGRALRALRLRGDSRDGLMIVEFCDTSSSEGLFRKYAAFNVGNRIIPCHVMVSRRWSVKSAGAEPDEASLREGLRYMEENPHADWLRRVFAIAGVDYGRIDYGVLDGAPQAWEINLNPTLGRRMGHQREVALAPELLALRETVRETFHSQLRAAFLALDSGSEGPDVEVAIPQSLIKRLHAEAARARRRRTILNWLQGLHDRAPMGFVRRTASRLFPLR
jgi:hypothetical protein